MDVLLNREGLGQQGGGVGLACTKRADHQQKGGKGGSRERGDLFRGKMLSVNVRKVNRCEHQGTMVGTLKGAQRRKCKKKDKKEQETDKGEKKLTQLGKLTAALTVSRCLIF